MATSSAAVKVASQRVRRIRVAGILYAAIRGRFGICSSPVRRCFGMGDE
jgi:hypothetical protein